MAIRRAERLKRLGILTRKPKSSKATESLAWSYSRCREISIKRALSPFRINRMRNPTGAHHATEYPLNQGLPARGLSLILAFRAGGFALADRAMVCDI